MKCLRSPFWQNKSETDAQYKDALGLHEDLSDLKIDFFPVRDEEDFVYVRGLDFLVRGLQIAAAGGIISWLTVRPVVENACPSTFPRSFAQAHSPRGASP